jgi:hypothetical protein
MDWEIEKLTDVSAEIKIPYERNKKWEYWVLCTADRHLDHALSDLEMQKKHLKEAKEGGWPVIDLGDLFCGMQGRFDPRATRKALLNCLNEKEEYMDALVEYGYEVLGEFGSCFALIGLGNHETSQLRRKETNLLARLTKMFRDDGAQTVLGAYQGWVRVQFYSPTKNGAWNSLNICYTHGCGGCAPVTRGVIQASRRATVIPDANIILSGHIHENWVFPITRYRLNKKGKEYRDEQLHIQVPSYKDELTGEVMGWAKEKGFSPKPIGAVWLKFWYENGGIKYDAIRAR